MIAFISIAWVIGSGLIGALAGYIIGLFAEHFAYLWFHVDWPLKTICTIIYGVIGAGYAVAGKGPFGGKIKS